ncbi:lysophospholipid acyltransferase family protein [Myxococcota bacterium]
MVLLRAHDWVKRRWSRLETRGIAWRRLAHWGANRGPSAWVRYSPTFFGVMFGCVSARERRALRANLRDILGHRNWAIEQMDVYRTLGNYAHCVAESLAGSRPEAQAARPCVLGRERLRQALQAGRGLVIVTAHVGAWDVALRHLAREWEIPVLAVMRRERDVAAAAFHDGLREQTGVRVLHVEHPLDGLALLGHLRQPGAVAIQLDRLPDGARAISGRLFGRAVAVPEGPFRLAMAAGAPVLPVFVRRMGYFDYQVQVAEARWLPRQADLGAIEAMAQATLRELEHFVAESPTQWFNFGPPD